MTLEIHLLGKPRVERSGNPPAPPKGRKVWALLAYLLRAENPVSREQLASLLFSDANDPLGALRWNLAELRRLLGDPHLLKGESIFLDLPAGTFLDVRILKTGTWVEAAEVPGIGRDLLEGMAFSSSPAFEAWLLNERRHLRASAEAVLREAALGHLALRDTDAAIDLAARVVALDPLDEHNQGLLVRSYAAAGDNDAASRQVAACVELFRRELGVEPGPTVTSAIQVSAASSTTRAAGGPAAARAQLEAGQAAIKAGAVESGLECLRRATAEAHACGDIELKLLTLFGIGSTLAHSGRVHHEEAAAALHEVIALAERIEDVSMRVAACRELAWIELLAARFGRTEMWLKQADSFGVEDLKERASILAVAGMYLTEVARYEESTSKLRASIAFAEQADDLQRVALSLSMLGRALLLRRELREAKGVSERAIQVARSEGWMWLVPWPEAYLAETYLAGGDIDRAEDTAEHAFALACEVGDPCFQAKAERTIGMVAGIRGDSDVAIERLQSARMRLVKNPDSTWLMGYVLDGLCSVAVAYDIPEGRDWINDLESLAGRTGMRELLARAYLHRHGLGDASALDAAVLLARDIDNPHLHNEIAERAAEPAGIART